MLFPSLSAIAEFLATYDVLIGVVGDRLSVDTERAAHRAEPRNLYQPT